VTVEMARALSEDWPSDPDGEHRLNAASASAEARATSDPERRIAEISKQLDHGILGSSGHANRGTNGAAFDQAVNHLAASLGIPSNSYCPLAKAALACQARTVRFARVQQTPIHVSQNGCSGGRITSVTGFLKN
jgi:hypothetical protein